MRVLREPGDSGGVNKPIPAKTPPGQAPAAKKLLNPGWVNAEYLRGLRH
jgi:hypothetical protein